MEWLRRSPQDYSPQQPGDEPDRPHLDLLQQVEPDLDHDEDDDDPLEPVRVADLELVAEALEQVVDDVQLVVEDAHAVLHVEVRVDAPVERLEGLCGASDGGGVASAVETVGGRE